MSSEGLVTRIDTDFHLDHSQSRAHPAYDASSRLTERTEELRGPTSDWANSLRKRYEYDPQGRHATLTDEHFEAGAWSSVRRFENELDAAGRPATIWMHDGVGSYDIIQLDYDADGTLVREVFKLVDPSLENLPLEGALHYYGHVTTELFAAPE